MIARIWRGVVRRSRCETRSTRSAPSQGTTLETAVYYPEDERYLIERDATVKHYGVADSAEPE